jgi:G3E family GTPase
MARTFILRVFFTYLSIFSRGCVCCSSSGELINALVEIAMRNDHEPNQKSIQHVILETTGLADPTPILQLIVQGADKKGNDDIVQNYYLNGIVTLIDTKHFYSTLSSISATDKKFKNELTAQILTTDSIILNKMDLLTNQEYELNEIKQFIHQYNPQAKIISTSYAKLPSIEETIFDLRPERDVKETLDLLQDKATEEALKKHDPSIEQTMLLASGGFVDLSAVQKFLKNIANEQDIYRIKGVLYLQQNPNKKYIIQGVAKDQLTILEGADWQPDEVKESRVTLIGKHVMSQCNSLEQEFRKCLIK